MRRPAVAPPPRSRRFSCRSEREGAEHGPGAGSLVLGGARRTVRGVVRPAKRIELHAPRARQVAASPLVCGVRGGGRVSGAARPGPRWKRRRRRAGRGVRAGPGAVGRAAAHAVAARLGRRVGTRRRVLQRCEAEPGRQPEVRVQEPDLVVGRHRDRPRTPGRRRHRRSLLPRPHRRPREARHHRRGPAHDAVGARDHEQPELRPVGAEPALGAPRPDPAARGRAGDADESTAPATPICCRRSSRTRPA